MNILTFDIEEWYIEQAFYGGREYRYKQFDGCLSAILDLLDKNDLKATFFCVGKLAQNFPHVIRLIDNYGHEIGCHSNEHQWLNKMEPESVLEDTKAAVDSLEQCIGKKVKSYRAPAFSIGKDNIWVFDILSECGITRDSSVYPAARDFGGFADFGYNEPVKIVCNNNKIKEFPIPMTSLAGKNFAYSGGGYFRFFPFWFVKRQMDKSLYNMTYFHIGDLVPEFGKVMSKEEYENYFHEKGTYINRYKRFLKSNLGKKHAVDKLERLLSSYRFVHLSEADSLLNWQERPIVDLS